MKKFIILLMFVSTVNAESIKNKNHGTLLVSEVTSIYDGDTFRVNIKGMHSLIGERISIRISGIDTPEIRTKCAKEKALAQQAKKLTVSLLRSAKVIELRNVKRGKYFRIIADVYADNKNISEILISSGLAVAYHGGTKSENWCK